MRVPIMSRCVHFIEIRVEFVVTRQHPIGVNESVDSHANDICNAIYLLIKKNIKVKNLILSSSKKTSVNSLIKSLLKKYSIQIQIKSQSKNNPDYILGENKLAKKILKWQPFKNAFSAFEDIFLNS